MGRVKDPVPQMRRVLRDYRSITGKQIVPVIKPGRKVEGLLDYLNGDGISGVCLTDPDSIIFRESKDFMFYGKVTGTDWLGVHRSPEIYKITSYYKRGDMIKIYEICGDDFWVKTDYGWSHAVKDGKRFVEF